MCVNAASLPSIPSTCGTIEKNEENRTIDEKWPQEQRLTKSMERIAKNIESVADILENPHLLMEKTLAEVQELLGAVPKNWKVEKLRKGSRKGQGWVLREYIEGGKQPTGRVIRWHPGGGHHGPEPYWRVSNLSGKSEIIRARSES